ncbi:zf-HC2 domain-containing protein [Streptomyces sp. NRRL F-5135]|uniref:zf-HC2 domain-containing protein n=1 Tax=Streptomyces sp. NRRL F-5135 TaxID=1463858 RepID=UPI002D218506|nr:zf-HC2 domain-containing protein [Streptomyces sp. NRRL F-5135]
MSAEDCTEDPKGQAGRTGQAGRAARARRVGQAGRTEQTGRAGDRQPAGSTHVPGLPGPTAPPRPHHVSESLISRYARGDSDIHPDELWAVEAHLESCALCRARLGTAARITAPTVDTLVEGVWAELAARLPTTPPARRRRRWVPALSAWASPVTLPWLGMTVLVTLFAVVLDRMDASAVPPVLLVAPVLPVLGVATAWARGVDPAYELIAATPRAGLELVLRRTTAILAVVGSALLLAGAVTGTTVGQWLLPCLAFTTGTLALGGLIGMTRAAIALVAAWAGVIVAPTMAVGGTPVALQADALPVWGALVAFGALVVVRRRTAYSLLGTHR